MTDHNLTDEEIRNLLKWRLLEQEKDDDLLTQKLTDMEAKLVFGSEALHVPSLQKENELLKGNTLKKYSFLKWLLPVIAIITISVLILNKVKNTEKGTVLKLNTTQSLPLASNSLPEQKTDAVVLTDSAFTDSRITELRSNDTLIADTVHKESPERFTTGDPGIRVDYKARKHDPKFVDTYDVPVLSERDKAITKKFKDKMLKQLIKKDKNAWSRIPMSTGTFYGETASLYPFYIATSEVTNNQYRTFLNDLIMQGKFEDYIKALPDTNNWIVEGRELFLKLQPDTTKWPGSPENTFEPMRKNYFWHPAYDSYPVVNVSREAAKLYCDWLTNAANEKIKKDNSESKWNSLLINDLRIPEDVEWMMAAKGGHDNSEYPWTLKKVGATKGPQNSHGCYLANFCVRNYKPEVLCPNNKFPDAYNSAGTVSRDYTFVAPVMSYNSNDYNLFCMAGNVAEMVWVKKSAGTKGGSWSSDADKIKIEAEDEFKGITSGSIYIGFRPVFSANKIEN
jgi:formylglycine-generating enzyme required for sulfatase activity